MHKRRQEADLASRAGKAAIDGILSVRPYSVVVVIAEVFFRKGMGERYFNGRPFFAALVFLILFRAYFQYTGTSVYLLGEEVTRYRVMDFFIGAYLLLSLWHFISQRLKRRDLKEMHHTYFIGFSRLAFLPRILGFRRYDVVAYRFFEPLFLLLLSVPLLYFSFALALLTFYAAFRLGYHNYKVLAESWRRILDILDSRHNAQEAQVVMEPVQLNQQRQPVRPPQRPLARKPKPAPRPSAPPSQDHSDTDLSNIWERMDSHFKDPEA